MSRIWWRLPGPSHFVSRIVRDLRDGKNIVLRLPNFAPPDLRPAVRQALEDGGGGHWETLYLDEEQINDPVELLCARYAQSHDGTTLWNINTLCDMPAFCGRIIWIEGMTRGKWPRWRQFLDEYQQVCRARDLLSRTVFVVPLQGMLADEALVPDICLTSHRWQSGVDRLDMHLYTAQLLSESSLSLLEKRTATAIIAHLAVFDPAVCEQFAAAEMAAILKPVPMLKLLGKERGWCAIPDYDDNRLWAEGMADIIDGRLHRHSALLCQNGWQDEVDRRIWSAEVGMLFPMVEEFRQSLLDQIGGLLRLPFQTTRGEWIHELRDLEIGHIESQMVSYGLPVSKDLREKITCFRKIRNSLAHLDPVDPALLIDLASLLAN